MKTIWVKIRYIIISTMKVIGYDLKSVYDGMAKPKEMMNILFWLCIIELYTKRYLLAILTIILYLVVYIWKIVKQQHEEWKHIMREGYKKYLIKDKVKVPPQ